MSDLVSAWLQTPEGSLDNQTAEESARKFTQEYLERSVKTTEEQVDQQGLGKSLVDRISVGLTANDTVLEEIKKQQGLLESAPKKTKKILKPKRTNTTKRKQKGRKSIADNF